MFYLFLFYYLNFKQMIENLMNAMDELCIDNMIAKYNDSPLDTLQNMLINTSHLMEQYMKNKNTATEGVVSKCIELNKIFIERISLEKINTLESQLKKLKKKKNNNMKNNIEKYHTTKDGLKIKVSELDFFHLENIINWIERKAEKGFTVVWGAGTGDDFYYDEKTLFGDDAKRKLNYSMYKDELDRRNLMKIIES